MIDYFKYLIEVNLVLTAGIIIYGLLLRRTTFYRDKRYYLLGLMGVSLVLPLMPESLSYIAPRLGATMIKLPIIHITPAVAKNPLSMDMNLLLKIIYAAGVIFFASMSSLAMGFTLSKIRGARRRHVGKAVIIMDKDAKQPSSFMKYIFWPISYPLKIHQEILEHELAHVAQGHSYDVIASRLFLAFNWFNPFAHWLKTELAVQHELLADRAATEKTELNPRQYSRLLLSQALNSERFQMAHPFFNRKTTKQRIMMLNKKKTNSTQRWKVTAAALLTVTLAAGVACTKVNNPSEKQNPHEANSQPDRKKIDKMPSYPNGHQAMIDYMAGAVEYPAPAKNDKVEGTVYLEFLVSKEGEISNIHAVGNKDKRLEKAAIEAVKGMPDWIPGRDEGKKVDAKMVLPIKFRLS